MRVRLAMFSVATSTLFSALSLAAGLVATPHLLKWLGDERFGAFRALSDLGGYLVLLELGFGGALLAILPKALAAGPDQVRAAMNVTRRAYWLIAILTVVGGAVLTFLAPWLIPMSTEFRRELIVAAFIIAISAVLVVATPFRLLIESAQRGYLINLLLIAQSLSVTGLMVFLVWRGWGLIGMSLATLIGAIGFAIGVYFSALHRWPELRRPADGPHSETWRSQLWQANWATLAMNLCGRLSTMSDNIIIGWFLGPAFVTPFFLTQRLISVASSQIGGIGSATWAALAEMHHRGESEQLRKGVVELSRLIVIFSGVAFISIISCNEVFLRLWVGSGAFAGHLLTVLASTVAIVSGVFSLWGWVFRGAGIIRPVVPVVVASTIVNVSVTIMLTSKFGWIEGPLLGTVISQLTIGAWAYPMLLRQHFGITLRESLGRLFVPVTAVVFWAAGAWLFVQKCQPSGWFTLLLTMSGISSAFVLFAWVVLLDSTERAQWKRRFRPALRLSSQDHNA